MKNADKFRVRGAAGPQAEINENSTDETPTEAPVTPPTEPSENREADHRALRPGRPSRSKEAERLATEARRFTGDLLNSRDREDPTHTRPQ